MLKFWKIYFIFIWGSESERDGEQSLISWFSPPMAPTDVDMFRSKPWVFSKFLTWLQGPKDLNHHPLLSKTSAGNGTESGNIQDSNWHPCGTAAGGFIHHTTNPHLLVLNVIKCLLCIHQNNHIIFMLCFVYVMYGFIDLYMQNHLCMCRTHLIFSCWMIFFLCIVGLN